MTQSTHQALLRQIPAVDQVLRRPLIAAWVERTGRSLVVSEIQALLQEVRAGIRSGDETYHRAAGMENLELLLDPLAAILEVLAERLELDGVPADSDAQA